MPVGPRFSAPVQTCSRAHPTSCTMGVRSLFRVKRPGRGVDHPSPSSAEVKERARLLLPLWGVIACSRLDFTCTLQYTVIALPKLSWCHVRFPAHCTSVCNIILMLWRVRRMAYHNCPIFIIKYVRRVRCRRSICEYVIKRGKAARAWMWSPCSV
jgi:hypothetical protein